MIETILLFASVLSPLIPISVGIRRRKSLLWMYVVTVFFFDLLIVLLKRVLHVPHHPATNTFVLVEFLLISFIYKKEIIKNVKLFYVFVFLMTSFFVVDTLNRTIFDLNTFGTSFFSFSYIIYAIAGFFVILKKQKVIFIERSSFFWVNVAFLLYASGNMLFFLFKDYLRNSDDAFFLLLWHTFFRVLNILKNIILAVALSRKTMNLES